MRLFASAFAALALAGCASMPPPPTVPISAAWSDDEVAWSLSPGRSTVTGQAVLRTVGGEARTCAGLEAHLIPDSAYARERLTFDYRSLERGMKSRTQAYFWNPDPAGYSDVIRTVICDAQGTFTFEGVPAGKYYVTALVAWGVPTVKYGTTFVPEQGGWLLGTVEVGNDQTRRVILSI